MAAWSQVLCPEKGGSKSTGGSCTLDDGEEAERREGAGTSIIFKSIPSDLRLEGRGEREGRLPKRCGQLGREHLTPEPEGDIFYSNHYSI